MRARDWPALPLWFLLAAACSPHASGDDDSSEGASAGAAALGTGGGNPAGAGGSSGAGAGGSGSGGSGASSGGVSMGGASGAAGNIAGGTGGAGASAGAAGGGGGGGTAGTTAGAGGDSAGSAGAGGGAGSPLATWHAAIASTVSDAMLASEYATWKSRHTQSCPDGSSVVKKDAGSVVSEGIGYGMLLAANEDDRPLFEGLWKYYSDHVDPNGLMNWSTGVCDAAGNNNANAATDGDLDVAMALIQAHARWPDGGFLTSAAALTARIAEFESEICDGRAILRPGDKFGGCSDTTSARVNPSYFAPAYYRVFASLFPEQAERWNALVEGSYALYPLYQARLSGLVPDWAAVDGSDWYGSSFSYDACRTPWRVMVDYAWSGDPRAATFLTNVSAWVDQHGLVGSQPNNSAFVGALALAAAYDQSKFESAVTTWLASNGDDMPYFQGTLRVLYLQAAAGKFPSTL